MKDVTNKARPENRLLFSKGTLAVLASVILLVTLIVSRKTSLHGEDSSPKNPLTEVAACRFALASSNGDGPVDQEIARQQALIRSGSTAALERLGWTFVKKARLTFDASF